MSRFLKSTLSFAACLSFGVGLAAAAGHPHEKETTDKSSATSQSSFQFEEDLNAHFKDHANRLREALTSSKGTKSRIIIKELHANDKSELASAKSKTTKRIEIIENPEELRTAARTIQNMLAESGILENLADVVINLAEDINLEDTGDGMKLSFDGKNIGGFSMNEEEESISIEAMGSNTTIEKEVRIENGKKITRIVIETDSDDVDFDIVPKAKKDSGTKF